MRILSALLILAAVTAQADGFRFYPYMSVGVGYKLQEPSYVEYEGERLDMEFGGSDTFTAEIGVETDYDIKVMIKHDSQLSTGWPFNNTPEYYKTEIMIKYQWGGK